MTNAKGNLPQWIAVAMLGVIGALVATIYSSLVTRLDTVEHKFEGRHEAAMRELRAITERQVRVETLLQRALQQNGAPPGKPNER